MRGELWNGGGGLVWEVKSVNSWHPTNKYAAEARGRESINISLSLSPLLFSLSLCLPPSLRLSLKPNLFIHNSHSFSATLLFFSFSLSLSFVPSQVRQREMLLK